MEKHSMLALSTAHITQEAAELLDRVCDGSVDISGLTVYNKGNTGWFIPVIEDCTDNLKNDDCPVDILACIEFTSKNGFDWIMFDRDVEPIPELTTYVW